MSGIQLIAVAAAFGLPIPLASIARSAGRERFHLAVCHWLGAGLLLLLALDSAEKLQDGTFTFQKALPMQLCDWALFACAAALLFRSQAAFDLAYFWGIGGTLQALFTPAIGADLQWWRLAGFFAIHAGIVAGVLYLLLARKFRPHPSSILRVVAWSEIYLAAALAVNRWTGGNYGFLREKPATHSMLDYLASDHWLYVLELNGMAILFFLALYAPWFAVDRARRPETD